MNLQSEPVPGPVKKSDLPSLAHFGRITLIVKKIVALRLCNFNPSTPGFIFFNARAWPSRTVSQSRRCSSLARPRTTVRVMSP